MKKENSANSSNLKIINEIAAIVLIFIAIFLILALSSFHHDDPGIFSITTRPVQNYAGKSGAFVASILFSLFGYASFFFVLLTLLYTIYFLSNRQLAHTLTKTFGLLLGLFSSAVLLSLFFDLAGEHSKLKTGGVVGIFFASILYTQLKKFLATIFSLSLLMISFLIITKVSLKKLITSLLRTLTAFLKKLWSVIFTLITKWKQNYNRKKIARKYSQEKSKEPQTDKKAVERNDLLPTENRRGTKIQEKEPAPDEDNLLFKEFKDEIKKRSGYLPPPISYLDQIEQKCSFDQKELEEKKIELLQSLADFEISGKIQNYTPGPVITTYEFVPDPGVKIKDVASLTEDLALQVKAQYVRIERILGKNAIGIEIPNKKREKIQLREIIESPYFQNASSPLTIALGKNTAGDIYITDLREMPHLLIAGATGMGKSVCIHTIILSIIYKSSPRTVKFILIDPKRVELVIYNALPHLLTNVINNPQQAYNALDWAVNEMEKRYRYLATLQVRNLEQFNKKIELLMQNEEELENLEIKEKMPYIVIIIDELADLMITSGHEIEENIALLAQKARAVGIHLILATQRPSVDVLRGSIKNNFPSRIAFYVPTKTDSRTIIDQIGADKLLGDGDMLFLPPKTASIIRLHGAYVSETEVLRIVNYLAKQEKPQFNTQITFRSSKKNEQNADEDKDFDALFIKAAELIIATGQASATFLQRKLNIGFPRAGRLIDQLEAAGIISPPNNRNQRDVLISAEEFQEWKEREANQL